MNANKLKKPNNNMKCRTDYTYRLNKQNFQGFQSD